MTTKKQPPERLAEIQRLAVHSDSILPCELLNHIEALEAELADATERLENRCLQCGPDYESLYEVTRKAYYATSSTLIEARQANSDLHDEVMRGKAEMAALKAATK